MENARDQAITDAWKNGGSYEGKQVTDAMLLSHWQDRLKGIAKDDPLYDTYKNTITQYEYTIAESKASTAYDKIVSPTAADDAKMASFYTNWAKKIPMDSEFYRVLQRDAAQFMRSSQSKATAASKANAEKDYQNQQKGIHDQGQAAGEYVLDALARMAGEGSTANHLTAIDATSLGTLTAVDSETMMKLIGLVTPSAEYAGPSKRTPGGAGDQVLYHDDNNKPVTALQFIQGLTKLDPHYNGHFSAGYIQSIIDTQKSSIQKQIALATKTGHGSDVTQLQSRLGQVVSLGRSMQAWPVAQDYMHARDEYNSVLSDPSATPSAKLSAWTKYQNELYDIAKDPRVASDGNFTSRILAEADMRPGSKTIYEDLNGNSPVSEGSIDNSEIQRNVTNITALKQQVADVAAGTDVWTQGVMKNGVFTPQPGGSVIGAAQIDLINANAVGTAKGQLAVVPDGNGSGTFTKMMLVGKPVFATATDQGGNNLTSENQTPIAYVYEGTINGQHVTRYSYTTPNGQMYSETPPWDTSKCNLKIGAKTAQLNISGIAPNVNTSVNGAVPGYPGWTVVGASPAGTSTTSSGSTFHPAKAGTLQFNPQAAAAASVPEFLHAGVNPSDQFPTLTQGLLHGTVDGDRMLHDIVNNHDLFQTVDGAMRLAADMVQDPNTMQWSGTAEAITKYNQWAAQSLYGINAATGFSMGSFPRATTAPTVVIPQGAAPFAGSDWYSGTKGGQPTATPQGNLNPNNLPSDSVRDTPFRALAALWHEGTNNLNMSTHRTGITAGSNITIPSSITTGTPPPSTIPHGAQQISTSTAPTPTPTPTPTLGGISTAPLPGAINYDTIRSGPYKGKPVPI
jgi:hypothetical protein